MLIFILFVSFLFSWDAFNRFIPPPFDQSLSVLSCLWKGPASSHFPSASSWAPATHRPYWSAHSEQSRLLYSSCSAEGHVCFIAFFLSFASYHVISRAGDVPVLPQRK